MAKSEKQIEHRRTLNIFVLAMLCCSVVISLRNLPLSAQYGLSSIFFYVAAAVVFMIPYALVSAELASGWPKGGGVFVWVREALGNRWGFFAIWMQWFHNMTWYPAMLAFIGAGLAEFLLDPALAHNKFYLIAVILIGFWGVTFLNFLGIKTSALVSTICVIIGVIIPAIFLVAFGIYWVASGQPLAMKFELVPEFSQTNLAFLVGIFLALAGLEANANLAREVKNPKRNYPKAIGVAALLSILILVLGALSIAIVIPKDKINLVSGLLDAFHTFTHHAHLDWLMPILALFIISGALGELNAWAIAGAKGLFVTSEHGLLPPFFHKMNKHYTPTNLMIFQGIIVTIATFLFLYMPNINISYWVLSVLSTQMYLLTYILLFIAGLVLRYTKPHVERAYTVPFQTKGMWVITTVGVAACVFALAMSFIPPATYAIGSLARFESILIIGFLLSCALPLVIYALRKPHWKIEITQDIRDEIHRSMH